MLICLDQRYGPESNKYCHKLGFGTRATFEQQESQNCTVHSQTESKFEFLVNEWFKTEVESSRTSSTTQFEVIGLETSSPSKLPCPRLEDSIIFKNVCFFVDCWKKIFEDCFFWSYTQKCGRRTFFCWRTLAACVLGSWPWLRAFLSLASRGYVLGRAVLDLDRLRNFFVTLSLVLASCLVSSNPPLVQNLNFPRKQGS